MRSSGRVAIVAMTALLSGLGCERVSRLDRPLPELKAKGLDGSEWNRQRLLGKPFVVNLWVPG